MKKKNEKFNKKIKKWKLNLENWKEVKKLKTKIEEKKNRVTLKLNITHPPSQTQFENPSGYTKNWPDPDNIQKKKDCCSANSKIWIISIIRWEFEVTRWNSFFKLLTQQKMFEPVRIQLFTGSLTQGEKIEEFVCTKRVISC